MTETQQHYFTPNQIAQRNNIGRSTVYRAIEEGRLVALRLGTKRGFRISIEAERAWLESCTFQPESNAVTVRDNQAS